ncbi:hypothetical protein EDB83DRAFT_2378855 [Lactarius deliciosus]|nr:hypothetical protein EDB83DRAFT_2378855 [Lactarius deliciosus]
MLLKPKIRFSRVLFPPLQALLLLAQAPGWRILVHWCGFRRGELRPSSMSQTASNHSRWRCHWATRGHRRRGAPMLLDWSHARSLALAHQTGSHLQRACPPRIPPAAPRDRDRLRRLPSLLSHAVIGRLWCPSL